MGKKLFIVCLKENFDFLDFWKEHHERTRQALKKIEAYHYNKGSQDPAEMFEKCGDALEAMQAFRFGLHRFGLSIPGSPGAWENCLDTLDPAKELPERIPFDFVQDKPAIAQELGAKDCATPTEAEYSLVEGRTPLKPSERILRVDLSRKKSDLLNDFKAFLDSAYTQRKSDDLPDTWCKNYSSWAPDTSREREEAWEQLKIWKKRKEKIPFSEIAKELKITEDAAKKAFYKAYERTQGKAYDPDKYRKDGQVIHRWDMSKTCDTCPTRKNCTEPCPEILKFIDQDHTSLRERLSTI